MSERRAEQVNPKPCAGHGVCAIVPVQQIDMAMMLIAAKRFGDALLMLRAMRNGPRRLEREAT